MTSSSPQVVAQAWLARHVVQDGREPELDEGDCTICGGAKGESHEATDPCGIISNLLAALTTETALREEWRGWAQFVYLKGGEPQGTDAELRARVCETHDADTERLEAECRRLTGERDEERELDDDHL